MSEQLLALLRFSLLALLYLFLFRVVRAVWAEITPSTSPEAPRRDRRARRAERDRRRHVPPSSPPPGAAAAVAAPAPTATAPGRRSRKAARAAKAAGTTLVIVEPASASGASWDVPDEATVGRGGGCHITLDDKHASALHARVFRSEGRLHVEDLGSTNGTFLNGERVGGPRPVAPGDRIKVGGTVLELR